MQLRIFITDECANIDGRYPSTDGKRKVAHSGFNVGFELNYWNKWCHLLGREPSIPVRDATKMMNSEEDNFMQQHLKVKYTEGHVWINLKAGKKEDCEALLKVSKQV